MIEVTFSLNRKPMKIKVDGERSLLWVLRTDLGLTGSKYGCGEGLCGACTVLVNNEAVRSCQYPVKDVQGKEVLTIEGLADSTKKEELHPLQAAFVDHNAVQCGYCTPGMILTAYSLLLKNPGLSRQDIISSLDDNLCRCGCYNRIVDAVESASKTMQGGVQ